MKSEEQVTSLELSKKLKKLGVKQESLFYWYQNGEQMYVEYEDYEDMSDFEYGVGESPEKIASAFTVAELGELLPDATEIDNTNWTLTAEKEFDGRWSIRYGHEVRISGESEAGVRAKMLIYLLENGLIDTHEKQQTT